MTLCYADLILSRFLLPILLGVVWHTNTQNTRNLGTETFNPIKPTTQDTCTPFHHPLIFASR